MLRGLIYRGVFLARMSEYLFAYGTLLPGLAPEAMAGLVSRLTPVGEGFARGVLYDLGEYPGAVLEPLSDQRIFGTVLRLPDDCDVLRELDAYEGFEADCPEASLFVRAMGLVEMTGGGAVECWIYVYRGPVNGSRVFESGRFAKK